MKVQWNRFLTKLIKWALPWIATFLTMLPYNEKLSRLLDRLTVIAEEVNG